MVKGLETKSCEEQLKELVCLARRRQLKGNTIAAFTYLKMEQVCPLLLQKAKSKANSPDCLKAIFAF